MEKKNKAKAKAPSEQQAVTRRAGLVMVGTLSSRVLGLLRDIVIAASFAVGTTDAFWLAFTIPNALRGLLGEGAVSGAFVPVLTDVREKRGDEAGRTFYAHLLGTMLLILLGVVLLGVLLAPQLVSLYASGFRSDAELFALTTSLTRGVFPYIGLMGVAALMTGALHAQKSFFAPAFSPLLLNVALIGAALLLPNLVESLGYPAVGALVIGALLGGALQILAQARPVHRSGMPLLPRFGRDPDVRRALLLLAPLLIGLGVYQLNLIASRQLASYLPRGSVSWLFYAQRIVEIPQGVFAIGIGSAALPSLAQMKARGEIEEAKSMFRFGLRLALFVGLPASVAIALLAEPIIGVFLGRGEFDAESVRQTAEGLSLLACGVFAVSAVRTIVPMFHALGDTRSPVGASIVNLVVFFSVSLLTMETMGHVGLALGISLAALVQLVVLLSLLRRKVGPLGLAEVATSALRSTVASAVMGGALFGLLNVLPLESSQSSLIGAGLLILLVVAGGGAFLGAATMIRCTELRELRDALRRKRPGRP